MAERFMWKTSEGLEMVGALSRSGGTDTCVIICHGFRSSKDSLKGRRLQEFFDTQDIASLRLDFYGHGESGGDWGDITLTRAVDQVVRASEALRPNFTRFALVGSSFGGAVALLATPRIGGLLCTALIAPVSDYSGRDERKLGPEGMDEWRRSGVREYPANRGGGPYRLRYGFYEDALTHDEYAVARSITTPVLVVHGDADTSVPVDQSRRLAQELPRASYLELAGAGHGFDEGSSFEEMLGMVSGFLQQRLR